MTTKRRPYDIPDAYYRGKLTMGDKYQKLYSDVVYYFDRDMNEVGYTVPWSDYVNETTRNRVWSPEILKDYEITRTFWEA